MTYSIVPIASQSPGLFPAQGQTNFTRLKEIISADHQFNDTMAGNDGFHKRISYINQVADPTIPAGANALGYSLSADLGTGTSRSEVFTKNAEGFQLVGARAYVMCDGRSTNGACTLNSQVNVTSVTRTSTGNYTVLFSRPMLTAKFATLVIAQPSGVGVGGTVCIPMLNPGVSYTAAQTTTTVLLKFVTSSGAVIDPGSFSVFIFGG